MTWFWICICIIAYFGIGVGVWKLSNLISHESWETVTWLEAFTIIWPFILLLQLLVVFYSSIFWVLTSERKFYKWAEYIRKQLEWE